jgi:predicted nucleic acid-binding protein
MKSTVYIETSVLSYLTARPSNDLRAMANQSITAEWWETRRALYEVVVSELVLSEASRGHAEAAKRRIEAASELPLLQISPEVMALAHPRKGGGGCIPCGNRCGEWD